MTGGGVPDPFAGHSDWALDPPRSIVPTPANMSGKLRVSSKPASSDLRSSVFCP